MSHFKLTHLKKVRVIRGVDNVLFTLLLVLGSIHLLPLHAAGIVRKGDVSSERDEPEGVLNNGSLVGEDRGAEADGELGDVNALRPRGDEVPALMHRHDGGEDGDGAQRARGAL